MAASLTPMLHLSLVYEQLLVTYGEPQNEPDDDPLGGLIGTILSQHTSDINSSRAYQQLIATFPTWEEVRDAPTDEVANAIRSGGLANVKAPRIQDVLLTLTEQQQKQGGAKALSDYLRAELAKHTTEDAWHYLRALPGVGPKTAACVLMFNLNRPAMPVDTHVFRTSQRLGLIGPRVNADKAHDIYLKAIPSKWVYPLHVNLITHGRKICHAQRPECNVCTLYSMCAYVGSVNVQETAILS